MGLISYFKTIGLATADAYTRAANPYDPFDRPALPKSLRTLRQREAECWSDFQRNFWFFDELIVSRIPLGVSPPRLDLGDQALWHGIYTAMLAMKYALSVDGEERIRLTSLIGKALAGMARHQDFHREGVPRLIRGYDRNSGRWEDDASNDTLTGHFAGLYFVHRYGPTVLKGDVEGLLSGIVQELVNHDLWLVNHDGSPTPYGKLIDGARTDPLRMTLALAIMTVGENLDLNAAARVLCHEIYTDYGRLIPYAKASMGALADNWNDDHRAALHLCILGIEDHSPRMREHLRRAVRRHWDLYGRRANPWVNALLCLCLDLDMPDDIRREMAQQNMTILSEFELNDAMFDRPVDARDATIRSIHSQVWKPEITMVDGHPRSTQPLPLWAMGAQDFPWQRHRYSVLDWTDSARPSQRFNGGAYLCAYWASRLTGLVPASA